MHTLNTTTLNEIAAKYGLKTTVIFTPPKDQYFHLKCYNQFVLADIHNT